MPRALFRLATCSFLPCHALSFRLATPCCHALFPPCHALSSRLATLPRGSWSLARTTLSRLCARA
eukprot:63554-Alexandrium_andersonii.AAC.1